MTRIDTATHFDNPRARRFYERHGFASLREERMSCLRRMSDMAAQRGLTRSRIASGIR